MTRFVIDAPVLIDLVRDGRPPESSHQLVAPNAIRSQAMDLLFQAVQRGDVTEQQALALHERVTTQKMRLLGDRVSRRTAWELAREHRLSSIRDAEYVAIAKLQADALITNDQTLAALAAGVVTLAPIEALFS